MDQGRAYNLYNNAWYELFYERNLVLLSRDGMAFLELPKSLNSWRIRIVFDSGHSMAPMPIRMQLDGDVIQLILTNWYSDSGVQNTEPLVLNSKDNSVQLLVMIRTTANRTQNYRNITVNIWKRMPEN